MSRTGQGKKVLVTGATGFVGRFICQRLLIDGWKVAGTLLPSEASNLLFPDVEAVRVDRLGADTSYGHCLEDVDTIIHLAARVHVMRETADDPLHQFEAANHLGTRNLAEQAARAGVGRFVFMSTIGVNGDNSGSSTYTERDVPKPHNHYSVSKFHAEQALQQVAASTGIQVVILRAPLVYGPGNPGNFYSLLRIVASGIPLPFASLRNRRSFIYVGNLVDALAVCAAHPAAAAKTFLVSDGEDVSTPDLIRRTAGALGVPARLLPFPVGLMTLAGRATGKSGAVNRLTGSLVVDSSGIRKELGWRPPFSMEEGLRETALWFRNLGDS